MSIFKKFVQLTCMVLHTHRLSLGVHTGSPVELSISSLKYNIHLDFVVNKSYSVQFSHAKHILLMLQHVRDKFNS